MFPCSQPCGGNGNKTGSGGMPFNCQPFVDEGGGPVWWGDATDEPDRVQSGLTTTAREDSRPTINRKKCPPQPVEISNEPPEGEQGLHAAPGDTRPGAVLIIFSASRQFPTAGC